MPASRTTVTIALGALLAVALAAAAPPPATRAQAGETLVFVVHGLRTSTGRVRGGIYASRDRWTQRGGQVATCTGVPSGDTARCTIRAPGPGRYAFAFFHDADDDEELDVDLLGIPQEAYGFSNDVRPGVGAPSFESAAFDVGAGATYSARVTARYGWSP